MLITCNKENILTIVLILVLITVIIIYYNPAVHNSKQNIEQMINVPYTPTSWGRNKCGYIVNRTLSDEFKKYAIEKDDNGWNLFLPCSYDNPKKEIREMPVVKNARYFMIDNADYLVAKEWLWDGLVKHYGLTKTCTLMPRSYLLKSNKDVTRFMDEYDKSKLYIMKKNIQQQKGLKISRDKVEIVNGRYKKYILAQELLQNPYLINGHKINLRCYILVICYNKEINVYVHCDGFMYYTKKPFVKNCIDDDVNITTGYIDREIYARNPLTHDDFRKYLDSDRRLITGEKQFRRQGIQLSELCFQRINNLIKEIFIAFSGKICTMDKFSKNVMFQLFGADIAIDDELNPMIMEINKGPDMNAKDKRDSDLKHGVVEDILRLVGGVNNSKCSRPNGFEMVLEVKK